MTNKYVLEVANLSKTFDQKKVVSNVSFKVRAGDIFGFLGPNGAGKTTIIRMILGLINLDSGIVKINGYDIKEDFNSAIKNVGSIVETPSFYDYLSGYDNLTQIANLHSDISATRINEVFKIVDLKNRAKDKVKTYSLGMKQRLGIARALLNKPNVVFLDEPTNGLDPQGMIEIRNLITQLANKEEITFFITTHMLHEVEQLCNRVAILKEGTVIAQDSVKNLLNKEQEIIEIHTSQPKKARRLLETTKYITKINTSSFGFIVELDKDHSSKLIKSLVSNNIKLDYLIPKKQSLEQLFFALTGGNQNP
ncbi:ABC transporter ATP-binding protein [Natroniella sulfidigena]|uniref:ABC transporter ATP-binding protein n=1 Tax=Natroniella sulfidigena TaxID=723921 RepID=UPI002009FED5|nr:ABC transporter ATP-binding protein [Natroniella sulfidigena]